MKESVFLIIFCMALLIAKYVISGVYYDYTLQQRELSHTQSQLIDENKRAIAEIENNRSANYLFSQKEVLGLEELVPEKTILLEIDKSKKLLHSQESY